MRRARQFFVHAAVYFSKFQHQVALVVQSSGGVYNGNVTVVLNGVLGGFKSYCSGVSVHTFRIKFTANTVGPDLELVHSSGSKSICGPQYHLVAALFKLPGQFANGGCLSYTIYAYNQ